MAKKKFLNKGGISDIIQKAKEQGQNSDTQIKENIVILEEFEKLIFPLSEEEFIQLEENIINEGCREPLVLWKQEEDKYALIDGHNRYKICQKHHIDFKIFVKDFEDVEVAKDWMINNQLGRRNVTEETKSWLRGLQYKREKKKQGWQVGQKDLVAEDKGGKKPKRTVQILAEQHNVSSSTIQRDEKFVDAVDTLVGDDLELRKKILKKEIKIPKTQLTKLVEANPAGAKKVGNIIKKGKTWQEAVEKVGVQSEKTQTSPNIQKLKKEIFNNIEKAINKKDKKALEESIQSLSELKGLLFN